MQILKRISLFILTNLLIMLTISIAWGIISSVFGLSAMAGTIPYLMFFCLVFGMGGAFVSLLISKWMAKTFYGVRILNPDDFSLPPDVRYVVDTVHGLARKANLPGLPQVGIYDSPDINAFATGPTKRRALVAVSTGLLQRMSRPEIEGVLGHEVTHIANGDMVTMMLIQGVVNSIAMFFSRILAQLVASNFDEKIRGVVRFGLTLLGDVLFTLLGSLLVAYFSRRREFRADAGGAGLASKGNMVSALRKLQSVYNIPLDGTQSAELSGQTDQMATLKISQRERPGAFRSLFMTHPPLEERIHALEQRMNSAG